MDSVQKAKLVEAAFKRVGAPIRKEAGRYNIFDIEGMNLDWTPNANTPNEFNDYVGGMLTYVDGKPTIIEGYEGTTEPGRYWTEHPMNEGGAARVTLGLHLNVWTPGDYHGHRAMIQAGKISVARDLNKDYKRDGDKVDTGMFGIFRHWGYNMAKADLGKSSAGCIVIRMLADQMAFMDRAMSDVDYKTQKGFLFSSVMFDVHQVLEPGHMIDPDTSLLISQAAIDLIVNEEVSSRAAYTRSYSRPTWPGGGSGVTIGIGYDIGAGVSSPEQLHNDWGGLLDDGDIDVLASAIGKTGNDAHALLSSDVEMQQIDVSWDDAMHVFENVDVPRWYNTCKKILPNWEKLNKDCKGALLSIAYNRGASFNGTDDRTKEMRNIKAHMIAQNFAAIPPEIRSMKRLWVGKGLDGLLARRDREADLFQQGLNKPSVSETVGAGTVAVGGGVVAKAMHEAYGSWWITGGVLLAGIILAVVVFEMINRHRQKVNTAEVITPTV